MRCRNKLVASLSMVIAVSVTSAVAQQSAINGSQGRPSAKVPSSGRSR